MPLNFNNLFSVNKLKYIKEKSFEKGCILCSIVNGNPDIGQLLVAQGKYSAVCVNKFPYNPGHILLFPKRHITDYRNFNKDEEAEINQILRKSLTILDSLYTPSGYNIGYNMGDFAGASIQHLHMHVIPRYQNELGCIDIIGGAKIIVEDPAKTLKELKKSFQRIGYK